MNIIYEILFYIIVFFILIECVLYVYIRFFASNIIFERYASLRHFNSKKGKTLSQYIPHRYLGYCPCPNYSSGKNRHNSFGYRGKEIKIPKPKEQYRIICMGDSTTYCDHIEDHKFSYPDLLENKMNNTRNKKNIEVVNAGSGGYGTLESLIDFETRILDLEPDLIVVYHGINDVHTRLIWPSEKYKNDNSGRRLATYNFAYMPGIWQYSNIFRISAILIGLISPHSTIAKRLSLASKAYQGKEFIIQKRANIYPSKIFIETSANEMLKKNRPKYFRRNIENIIAIAKQRNITVLLVSFATSNLFKNKPTVTSEEYMNSYYEMNSILKKISTDLDVYFLDLAKLLPKDKKYWTDGRHVNELGSEIKAKIISNYIENEIFKNEGM